MTVLFVRKLNNLNLEHRPWYIVYILIYFFKVTRRAIEQINPEKTLPLHVSLDIDVLDPNEAPATGTRGTFHIWILLPLCCKKISLFNPSCFGREFLMCHYIIRPYNHYFDVSFHRRWLILVLNLFLLFVNHINVFLQISRSSMNHISISILHGISWCESSNFLMQWKISHKDHICNFFVLHGVSWCVF